MNVSLRTLTLFIASAVAGCSSGSPASPSAEPAASTSQADTSAVDLISNKTCTQKSTRLVSCKIGPDTLTGTPIKTAVPLRTVLTPQKAGNCSTQYPLQLTAKADDGTATTLAYLSATNAYVRRADGLATSSVILTDSSTWTPSASFDSTCSIELGVAFNQPDVDTVAQAQAILAKLEQDLAAKETVAENYQSLMLFNQAYQFMTAAAQNFYVQLTNGTMQDLRDAQNASSDALLTLITSCDVGLTQDQKVALLKLYSSLPVLGSSTDWTNPDGSLKTLADLIGPTAQSVLTTVQGIIQAHDADAGNVSYETLYGNAETAVVTAEAAITLARQQLAPWLGTPDGGL